jgi:DNA-binding NarL/FixJ family response regulator
LNLSGGATLNADIPKSLRILVVDDHEIFRKQVYALLGAQPGFEVVGEAGDGLEAVRRAEDLQPDIVVLDVTMPVLGGIEAGVRIRQVAPKSQIVFLSQYDSEAIAHAALATGALAYVTKSSAATDLIPAVQAVSDGKKFLSKLIRGVRN